MKTKKMEPKQSADHEAEGWKLKEEPADQLMKTVHVAQLSKEMDEKLIEEEPEFITDDNMWTDETSTNKRDSNGTEEERISECIIKEEAIDFTINEEDLKEGHFYEEKILKHSSQQRIPTEQISGSSWKVERDKQEHQLDAIATGDACETERIKEPMVETAITPETTTTWPKSGDEQSSKKGNEDSTSMYLIKMGSSLKEKASSQACTPYTCNECGKLFTATASLRRHERVIHKGEQPYVCEECGKSFAISSDLKTHQHIHTGVKRYNCLECGKSFTRARNLAAHQLTHTGVTPYNCLECGKSFTRARNLAAHQLTHTGAKPYTCDECGKSFTSAWYLGAHKQSHKDVQPYICAECGKSFITSSDMKKHLLTHTGAKPYTCDECGKSFTRASYLSIHQRIHTGVKPYVCGECGKSFNTLFSLTCHSSTHSGIKPYTCDECGRSFSYSNNLKRHQVTHTGANENKKRKAIHM